MRAEEVDAPKQVDAPPDAQSLTLAGGAVNITVAGPGSPFRELRAPAEDTCAFFAGTRPRTLAHASTLADLTLLRIRAETAWGQGKSGGSDIHAPTLRKEFRAAEAPVTPCSPDALLAALMAEFESAYKSREIKSRGDFLGFAAGETAAQAGGYICAAIARVTSASAEKQIRASAAQTRAAPLRTPPSAIERTVWLTALRTTLDAAKALLRVLRPELEALDLHKIDWDRPTPLFVQFRRAAERALTAPLYCNNPSFLLYALTV
jgi:hypothetical protein